ncbi:MAG: hypothetical protein FJ304_09550 [Planctomycetes bacterium]|nr:hypothetical protein [Planctomycetota bacterium]
MLRALALGVVMCAAVPGAGAADDADWTGKTVRLKVDVKLGTKFNGGLVREGAALPKGKTFVVKSDAGGFLELVDQTGFIFRSEAEVVAEKEKGPDTRELWVYEGGWFARKKDGSWYEVNEENYRRQKSLSFREVKRTAEFVELYDANRKVSVRLGAGAMDARWDADGPNAVWKPLYKGRWQTPTP